MSTSKNLRFSDVKTEMENIAIAGDVVFPFGAHFSSVFRALFAAVGDIVVIGDGFGTNESAFKVGVNDACTVWGGGPGSNSPRAGFLWASGEESQQAQQIIARTNDAG